MTEEIIGLERFLELLEKLDMKKLQETPGLSFPFFKLFGAPHTIVLESLQGSSVVSLK